MDRAVPHSCFFWHSNLTVRPPKRSTPREPRIKTSAPISPIGYPGRLRDVPARLGPRERLFDRCFKATLLNGPPEIRSSSGADTGVSTSKHSSRIRGPSRPSRDLFTDRVPPPPSGRSCSSRPTSRVMSNPFFLRSRDRGLGLGTFHSKSSQDRNFREHSTPRGTRPPLRPHAPYRG